MAPPDLNTLPSSPRDHNVLQSRRASHMTGTPLLPNVQSSGFSQQDDTGVPMRHPRPLTAAELHLELEKEQEAVVNRLARELSALRAQHSASTASNASSSHSSAIDPTSATSALGDQLPPIHTIDHRHRSSSSVSTRSVPGRSATPSLSVSQASVERARDATGMRSRDNSLVTGATPGVAGVGGVTISAVSRSRAPSASPSPSVGGLGVGMGSEQYFMVGGRQRRESNASVSGRMEEMERARAQLEIAWKENAMLATRVRELEGLLKDNAGKGGGTG